MLIQKKYSSGGISIDEIRNFVRDWNITYPIDYWWRQKYKIPFGSEAHQAQNILDMRIEFEEDLLVREQMMKDLKKEKYLPGRGNWLKKRSDIEILTEERASDIFDNLDIGKLQEQDIAKLEKGEKTGNSIDIKR